MTSVISISSSLITIFMRLSRFSFLGVVATNVLGNVWKSDNDDSENTATSDTDLLVLKGQVKMELLEMSTHKFTGLSQLVRMDCNGRFKFALLLK